MAVSGTTSFTLTRDEIISYALRKLAVLELGATPDTTTVTNAATSLDMMIKSWVARGSKLWTIQELTLPLTANKSTYTIGPTAYAPDLVSEKPLYLMQAWIRNTSLTPQIDIPMQVISQHDYNLLGAKGSTGTPNSMQMFVGRDVSTLHIYVTPDAFSAGIQQAHLLVKRTLMDAGTSTTNMDFPQEWLKALGWNLAAELLEDYEIPPNKAQRIEMKAEMYLREAEDFDVENASTFFAPGPRFK